MSTDPLTPGQEYDHYSDPQNQQPQGSPRRRRQPLTTSVPVHFPDDLLDEVKRAAEADDLSVSAWIRRAVERELTRSA